MSLVSVKNLVAPLSHKVHLTTIFLAAIVFVVLRFSSGAVEIRSEDYKPAESTERRKPAAVESTTGSKPARRSAAESGVSKPASDERDLLEALKIDSPPRKPKAEPKEDDGGSLGEIERSLGLR